MQASGRRWLRSPGFFFLSGGDMYGVYSWNAGITAGQIQQDLVALLCGSAIDDLSAGCNKAATTVGGAASGFVVVDQPFGVLSHPGQAGGPGILARITVSAGPRVQLAAVDQWNMGTHAAAFVTNAADCSNLTTAAGSLNFIASAAGLLLASSDWGVWAFVGEVKRDGPAFTGDAAAPGGFIVSSGGYCYMPRLKSPNSVGDLSNASCQFASAFGQLSAAAARTRAEVLYLPMAPAVVSYGQVPVGEVAGLMTAGGYGQGGDFIVDSDDSVFQIVKNYNLLYAVPKV